MTIDFSGDVEEIDSNDVLAQLSKLAALQVAAEAEVLKKENELKEAQQRLAAIAEVQIPELMDEVGMKEFKTVDGLPVKVVETMRASIPKTRNLEAIMWLDKNGYGNIVKRLYTIQFNKDEGDKAAEFAKLAAEANFAVDESNTVHAMTLASFIKEQLAKGIEIPLDLFGAYLQRKAKVG